MARKHNDKRTVTTDALETLGMIHGEGQNQKRDAIHLAVEPVEAGEDLEPASHISVMNGIATLAEVGKGLGIVDPFLTDIVKKGEKFWFVMYPRMVRSLRHVWTHPAFADEPGVHASEAKVSAKSTAKAKEELQKALEEAHALMQTHAGALDLSYEDFMSKAEDFVENGEWHVGGAEAEGYTLDPEKFWPAWELITGRTVEKDKRHNFIGCSC
jgi:ElaB/YqjD/DUF883 family membrane-anchored ribosome-binding protein